MKTARHAPHLRQENIIYLAVWTLLFAAPVLSLYVRATNYSGMQFDWHEVLFVWSKFSIYLLLFLLHNFLLAPLLIRGSSSAGQPGSRAGSHLRIAYFAITTVVLATFSIYQCTNKPHHVHHPHIAQTDIPARQADTPPPPPQDAPPHHLPPPIIGEHDILGIVILILMFIANLGVKVYYKSGEDHKRMEQLERQNLTQQLEYLRLQINPHFFMNTLNNIHALIDINPTKAQETIVKLSNIMRFVLYEGNKQYVPLVRELDFIADYMKLMKLRYTDDVRITLNLPANIPDRNIPPLILTTFIENAFKHGVSYQRETYIHVTISIDDDTLLFTCRNTRNQNTPDTQPKGGMGLANVRKRLDLLYADSYRLQIHPEAGTYTVLLTIPLIKNLKL